MATILVVDDRPTNRQFLVTLLGYLGHRVVEAADGIEALKVSRAELPSLVIVDIVMPRMDGVEFVRQLRKDSQFEPAAIIFYTATYRLREAEGLARKVGVTRLLQKPAQPEEILEAVESALREAAERGHGEQAESTPIQHRLPRNLLDLERLNIHLTAIIELVMDLTMEDDPHRMINTACRAARSMCRASYAAMGVLHDNGDKLRLFAWEAADVKSTQVPNPPPPRAGVLAQVLDQSRCFRLSNDDADLSLLAPPDHPPIRSLLAVPLATHHRVLGWLYLIDKINGEPFTDEDERLLATLGGFVAMAYDNLCVVELERLTFELQKSKEQLECANEYAETANRAKTEFLANMSHELRTPLNGVIGMTELLTQTDLSAKQRQYVEACHDSGESLLQLINNILDFSKIEAGKMELDLHDFELEKLVTDTVDMMAWRALEKALEMPCYVEQASRTILKGDSNRLRQILVNLVGNAIKFTEAGEVVVRAKSLGRQDDRITVRFSISDTGIGIPSDKLDRLFQSYSQVDSCTTRKHGGTGLGLAISQSLVELMAGTIGVDSDPGKGSTFWFEVPFVLVSDSSRDASGQSQLAGLRALIVDDNETNRIILKEYASDYGLASITTASVDEALAAIERANAAGSPFHVVLSDYNMPERNGLELSRALKQHPQLIVLLLGSTDICLDPDQMREHGIDAILRKPLRRHELYDVLCGLFDATHAVTKLNENKPRSADDVRRLSGHILLAEDNSINNMYIVELLKQIGCTCDTVTNGREATEAVRQRSYDLVLMDCQMPKMDGFDATRKIRQWESDGTLDGHLPVIALTANAVAGDRKRCLDAGMDEYLSKPVQANEVTSMFARFLGVAHHGEVQHLATGAGKCNSE